MKTSIKSKLSDLTEQEIASVCRELRQTLFSLRMDKATGKLEKSHKIRDVRKDIARCETRSRMIRKSTSNA